MNSMGKLAIVCGALSFLGLSGGAFRALADEARSGEEILTQIVGRAFELETTYMGSFSRRNATTRILDGNDGELKSTRDVVLDVWEYHGEGPTNEVRECKIDDESAKLEKCAQEQRLEPAYRLFDRDSEEHYRFEYAGLDKWKGQPSHKLHVIPVENTTRHLKGDIFFRVESLEIVGMDITLADFPFGLKALSIELNFSSQDGLPMIVSGKSDAHIHVPFLINDRSVTEFTASNQRVLRQRHAGIEKAFGG